MVGGDDDEKQVRIDAKSGAFYYQDLGELWTDPARARALPATGEAAAGVAHQFLAAHDNLPGVFEWNSQIPPTVELEMVSEAASPEIEGQHRPLLTNATQWSISYMRTINVDGVDLSIVGPGSRQNVYIGDGGEVIGLKSGYVPLQIDPSREVVPILTAEEAWNAFLADPTLAVAQPPTADLYSLTATPPTLAYYQQPTTESQQELIPVWVFEADLYVRTEDERATTDLQIADDALIYVQAEETAGAQIEATIDAPAPPLTLRPGQTIDLAGSATGGTEPYTFEWSSEVNGTLGQGETLNGVSLSADTRASSFGLNQVTLTVTDANGLQATATLDINVLVGNYLPAIRPDC